MRFPSKVAMVLAASVSLLAADPHLRFARVTLAEDRVELEDASGRRTAARPNVPAGQGFWIETAAGRAELELDEGSLVRLGPASLAELSDLTRLSSGQRVTHVSLERGTLYVTAEPAGADTFTISLPGVELALAGGSRVRADVDDQFTTVAVFEGRVRFSSRPAEMELTEGRTVRVDPGNLERFELFREVKSGPLDAWNEQRDKQAALLAKGTRITAFPVGLGELDAHGTWTDVPPLGRVWRPRVREDWAPFRSGQWRWDDQAGYVWVSSESWGWLPYHYGRWARVTAGWVWAPDAAFHAGEVYWLRSGNLIGWGPLAPGETWHGEAAPSLYSPAATTYAVIDTASRVIDPGTTPRRPAAASPVRWLASLPAPPAERVATARTHAIRVGATPARPVTTAQDYNAPHTASGIRIIGAEPPPPPPAPPPAPGSGYYYYPYIYGPPQGGLPDAVPMADEPQPGYDPGGGYWPGVIYLPRGPYRPAPGLRPPPGVVIRPGSVDRGGTRPPAPGRLAPPVVSPGPGPSHRGRSGAPESGQESHR